MQANLLCAHNLNTAPGIFCHFVFQGLQPDLTVLSPLSGRRHTHGCPWGANRCHVAACVDLDLCMLLDRSSQLYRQTGASSTMHGPRRPPRCTTATSTRSTRHTTSTFFSVHISHDSAHERRFMEMCCYMMAFKVV